MKSILLPVAGIAALFLCLSRSFANVENRPMGVGTRIWATGNTTATGTVSISGSGFLPSTPGNSTVSGSDSQPTTGTGSATASLGSVQIEPGKTYSILVGGTNLNVGSIHFVAAPGYQVYIESLARTRSNFNGSWSFRFHLERLDGDRPTKAGDASTIGATSLDWLVGLGTHRNGSSVGNLQWIDTGAVSNWAPLFTPALLNYETDSDEVAVYRPSGVIRQIVTNQAFVDIVPDNTSSPTYFDIRYYHPSNATGSSFPYTPTSGAKPFVSYRVQPGGSAQTAELIREVWNTSSSSTSSRVEKLPVARSSGWPNFSWANSPWTVLTGNGTMTTPVADFTLGSSNASGNRTETIGIAPDGVTSPLTVDLGRTYITISGIGEVVSQERVGTGSQKVEATFDYYLESAGFSARG